MRTPDSFDADQYRYDGTMAPDAAMMAVLTLAGPEPVTATTVQASPTPDVEGHATWTIIATTATQLIHVKVDGPAYPDGRHVGTTVREAWRRPLAKADVTIDELILSETDRDSWAVSIWVKFDPQHMIHLSAKPRKGVAVDRVEAVQQALLNAVARPVT